MRTDRLAIILQSISIWDKAKVNIESLRTCIISCKSNAYANNRLPFSMTAFSHCLINLVPILRINIQYPTDLIIIANNISSTNNAGFPVCLHA